LIAAARVADVGPLQALVDELDFNQTVAKYKSARFADEQFRRAIQFGAIAILNQPLRSELLDAYASMAEANNRIAAEANQDAGTRVSGLAADDATRAVQAAAPRIGRAFNRLLAFLSSET
jgi:hypothetical protein